VHLFVCIVVWLTWLLLYFPEGSSATPSITYLTELQLLVLEFHTILPQGQATLSLAFSGQINRNNATGMCR
jgi:hypothetical protein